MPTTREAIAILRADDSQLDRGLRKGRRKFDRYWKNVRKGAARQLKRVEKATLLAIGVGFAGGLRSAVKFQDRMQRMGSQAGLTAKQIDEFSNSVTSLSGASGVARAAITDSLEKIVDLQGGTALTAGNMNLLALAMKATGVEGRDLAKLVDSIGQNMAVTDDNMQRVLGGIDKIGTTAKIPLAQLAQSYTEVAGAASQFGEFGEAGVFRTVAAMQVLRRSIGSVDEVKTSLTAISQDLIKKRGAIKAKFGVDVTQNGKKDGELRPVLSVMEDIARSGATATQIVDTFGKRSAKGMAVFVREVEEYQKLVAAGNAGADGDFLQVRALERAESKAGRVSKAMNDIKIRIAEAFTPERMERVAEVAEKFARFLGKALDHAKAIAAVYAGLKLAQLASAATKFAAAAKVGLAAGAAEAGSKFGIAAKAGMIGASLAVGAAIGTVIADKLGIGKDETAGMSEREKLVAKRNTIPLHLRHLSPQQRALDSFDAKQGQGFLGKLASGTAFTGPDLENAKRRLLIEKNGTAFRAAQDTSLDGITAGDVNRATAQTHRLLKSVVESLKDIAGNTKGPPVPAERLVP